MSSKPARVAPKTKTSNTKAREVKLPTDQAGLDAAKARTQKEIDRRKGKAPGFTNKLEAINKAISALPGGGTAPGTPSPTDPSKVGGETDDIAKRALAWGNQLSDQYLGDNSGAFGTITEGTSPEMQAYLNRLNQEALDQQHYTGDEQFALDQLRGGLGGYMSPELQAMREQRLQEVDAELGNQQRQAALAAARGGVRGAYAGAQQQNLARQAVQTRGNIEQDLFVKNADEIENRKKAFADLVGKTEQARFGRQNTAETLYGSNLGGEENVQRGIKQFNIGQNTNKATARAGLAAAGAGTYAGLYGNQAGFDQAKMFYDQQAQQGKSYFDYLQAQLKAMQKNAEAAK